ncbi:MAG: phytoene desaturase family protein [Patescibacteria group bacterium]|nr:phytoene desaturase family protein [Patescibacteria group bacterium]
MNLSGRRVVVVGGGIGGLATSALLGHAGYQVTIIEKNRLVGGRARYLKLKNFFFDMGPSWYMMPEVFENYFQIFGKKTTDYYKLIRLKTHYRIFFENKTTLDITSDLEKNKQTFKKLEKDGNKKLELVLKKSAFIYNQAMKELVFQDYRDLKTLLRPKLLFDILFRFDLFRSLHDYVKAVFRSKKLQKVLEYTTVFLGGSPFNTPAFYKLVTHADFNLGIYYPKGGIYQVVKALKDLAEKNGVIIKTKEEVKQVTISHRRIIAVVTDKTPYPADIVVVNADYPFFETKILPPNYQTYPESYWRKKVFSPSAFLIYLGIRHPLEKSDHHNLFFTDDWENHFREVYQKRAIPTNPSFYWHVPTKTDLSLAPKNHHSVMILVPMPPGVFLNEDQSQAFSIKILRQFAHLNQVQDIEKKIVVKKIFQGTDFLNDYRATLGAAFGLAHTFFQTALFRPKNFSSKIKNLFYVGQHTNPGVGMPPVLISAQIVAKLVNEYGQRLSETH